jgi:CRP-like cAMP-binding protein
MEQESLKGISIFFEFSPKEIRQIEKIINEITLPANSLIFEEGQSADCLYIIERGQVAIEKKATSEESITTLTLRSGDFFGEMALFDEGPRSAKARTLQQSRLLIINKTKFMDFLEQNPKVAAKLLVSIIREMVPRIRQTNKELACLYRTGKILGSDLELYEKLDHILGVVLDVIGTNKGAFLLTNEVTGQLEVEACRGIEKESLEKISIKDNPGLCKWLKKKEAIIIDDISTDQTFENFPLGAFANMSILAVPLFSKERSLGMVLLGDKIGVAPGQENFTANDRNLVVVITNQINQLLEATKLLKETQDRQRLERKYYKF